MIPTTFDIFIMDVAADNQQKTLYKSNLGKCFNCTSLFYFQTNVERECKMATKANKKEHIRNQIIAASRIYSNNLAGKVFLYVIGEEYFEVVFQTNRFMHLTGVNSTLNAQNFYDKAKDSILTTNQFYFDDNHPYASAKKKLSCLIMLPNLTNSLVCVIKDMQTVTLTYKIGITNIDFTIGLTENTDFSGNKINDWFLPRTLRVKDKAIDNNSQVEFVDFIFSKDASREKYTEVTFMDKDKPIPSSIKSMLSPRIKDSLNQQ